MTNVLKSPCQGCKHRKYDCHSKCGDYIEYKVQMEDYNEWKKKIFVSDPKLFNRA